MSTSPPDPAFGPRPSWEAQDAGSPAPRRRSPLGWVLAVIVLVVALAAASTVAVVQSERLSDARDEVAQLEGRVEEDAARIESLQESLEERPGAGGLPEDLEDLFGGEGGLEDLFGGEGGLEDLFGEDGAMEDLLGDEGGLGDLFGGEGGLEDLFGAAQDAPDVAACITDVEDLPDISDDSLDEQFDEVADAVQTLRGLEFPSGIDPTIMTAEEIREVFTDEVTEVYPPEQADEDRRILSALQAVPPDIDLVQAQIDLLSAQVAGYYDDETGELVVRAEAAEEPLGGLGLIALAHEMEHALVDATIGLPDLDGYGDDEDAQIAALSVVEGSAVALQTRFQTAALSLTALLGDPGLLDTDQGLDEVPPYIAESLTFPYIAGPSYACDLYAQGGWDAVDAALTDPPSTTHQVMFPGADIDTVDVAEPAGPDGYDLATRRTFGAAALSWLFAAPDGDESAALADPSAAVEGWRGGEVSLWTADDDSAVALTLAGNGLCDPVTDWWQAASGGEEGTAQGSEQLVRATGDGDWGVVTCDADDVRVGVGPDVATARAAIT